jgi:predicted O-methyltransferase YrrM
MPAEVPVPPLVAAATARASQAGFPMSCDPAVGRLLTVLAAHLPEGARMLELGTGAGVGAAWIVSGLLPRTDVTVTSVESDPGTAARRRCPAGNPAARGHEALGSSSGDR